MAYLLERKIFGVASRKKAYDGFDLDSCLKNLEQNHLMRDAALAAFWGTYLSESSSPVLSDQQFERIERLLGYSPSPSFREEDLKDTVGENQER